MFDYPLIALFIFLVGFTWRYCGTILKRLIYLVLLTVILKLILHNKSYYFNNIKEISDLATDFKNYESVTAFDAIQRHLFNKYPDIVLADSDWQMCRYNGEVASLKILHISLTEQLVFIGRKYKTIRFYNGNFLTNMTEIVVHGSVKVWNDADNLKIFDEFQVGNIMFTKSNKKSSSPSFEFFNNKKLLIEYEADTWTVEYTRSFLPLWLISSFFSNFIYFDFSTLIQLSSVIAQGFLISIHNFIMSLLDLAQDCCSSKDILNFFK